MQDDRGHQATGGATGLEKGDRQKGGWRGKEVTQQQEGRGLKLRLIHWRRIKRSPDRQPPSSFRLCAMHLRRGKCLMLDVSTSTVLWLLPSSPPLPPELYSVHAPQRLHIKCIQYPRPWERVIVPVKKRLWKFCNGDKLESRYKKGSHYPASQALPQMSYDAP